MGKREGEGAMERQKGGKKDGGRGGGNRTDRQTDIDRRKRGEGEGEIRH